MAHEMELAIAVSHFFDDVERVADEPVDPVMVEIGRVGARAGRIAALVRRHDEVTRRGEHRGGSSAAEVRHASCARHPRQSLPLARRAPWASTRSFAQAICE